MVPLRSNDLKNLHRIDSANPRRKNVNAALPLRIVERIFAQQKTTRTGALHTPQVIGLDHAGQSTSMVAGAGILWIAALLANHHIERHAEVYGFRLSAGLHLHDNGVIAPLRQRHFRNQKFALFFKFQLHLAAWNLGDDGDNLINCSLRFHGNIKKRDADATILLDEELGWLGLGYCDGGDIGSGEASVYSFVVDYRLAEAVLRESLKSSPFADFKAIRRGAT
jgi:hypothetical protein